MITATVRKSECLKTKLSEMELRMQSLEKQLESAQSELAVVKSEKLVVVQELDQLKETNAVLAETVSGQDEWIADADLTFAALEASIGVIAMFDARDKFDMERSKVNK